MLDQNEKTILVDEMSDWGTDVLKVVLDKCQKYGVLCHSSTWSDGKKG